MPEPLSLAAISATFGAVGLGMANEAGKAAWETAGALVRRIVGREVPAPQRAADVERVAALVQQAVSRDPELARLWTRFASTLPAGGGHGATPRLPASPRFFTDRRRALRLLDREAKRRFDGRPRVALLYGPEGIGASATALHWGSLRAADFPDGQLHVDLRGWSSQSTLGPAAAAGHLLRGLGLPAEQIPPAAERRLALLQWVVADLRLLIVLDHAYSAAQVRPLLTSAPGVFTLVTARHPLPGLDAVPVGLGPLPDRDARRLLSDLAGSSAVAAAPGAAKALLVRCGGSPYALRAAAPLLSARVDAGESAVDDAGPVRALTDSAYRVLDADAARLYRLLALRAWPAADARTAAWTIQAEPDHVARLLGVLHDRGLLETSGADRYRFRPAVRRHAEALARHEDGLAACAAAIARVVRGYADLAEQAAHHVLPESWRVPAAPEASMSRAQALGVLAEEAANVVEALHAAVEFEDYAQTVRLGRSLWPLQLKAGRHDEAAPALRAAIRLVAGREPRHLDPRGCAALRFQLAMSLIELGEHEEAEAELRAAAGEERAAGHVRGHASVVEALGLLRLRQWRWAEALDCFERAHVLYGDIGPGDEGHADLPRALALVERHRGRALRGLGRYEESRVRLRAAIDSFRGGGDAYNTARALTDLAETHLDAAEPDAALPLTDEAIALLEAQGAEYPLAYARSQRARCLSS